MVRCAPTSLAAERLGTLAIVTPDTLNTAPSHNLALRLTTADFDLVKDMAGCAGLCRNRRRAVGFRAAGRLPATLGNAMIAMRHALGPRQPAAGGAAAAQGGGASSTSMPMMKGETAPGSPCRSPCARVHNAPGISRRWRDSLSFLVSGGIAARRALAQDNCLWCRCSSAGLGAGHRLGLFAVGGQTDLPGGEGRDRCRMGKRSAW